MSDRDLELETVLRWDRETNMAMFYTADPVEMKRWQRLGYDVTVCGTRQGRPSGWRARVPVAAVALLPLRPDGTVQVSRYLNPPSVVTDRAVKARGRELADRIDENTEENGVESSGRETSGGDAGERGGTA